MSLKDKYEKEVKSKLKEEFGIKNIMATPKLTKIVINIGTGDAYKSKDSFGKIASDLSSITGQKAKITTARSSIAGFNIRAGMQVGLTVTLRGIRMYDFFERFVSIVLPRLRDFRGVPTKSFDKNGNYTLGLVEHTVFPEIDLAKVEKARGMEITFVTKDGSPEKSKRLLELLGMPFEKPEEKKGK